MVFVHHQQYLGCYVKLQLTVHSWFSKKDVNDGNVLFIGIVLQFILQKNAFSSILFVGFCNLRQGSYELFFTHRVWVLQSHRPWCLIDIILSLVSIRLQHARLPQCQRGGAQVAKGTQVQISRITWTEGENIRYEKLSLTLATSIDREGVSKWFRTRS